MFVNRFVVVTLLIVLACSSGLSVGKPGQEKKRLPLDVLPGVTLKTPENSKYLPNKVIIRLKDGAGGFRKASAALLTALERYLPSSVETIFPATFGAASTKPMDLSKFVAMTYSSPSDPFTVAAEISNLPEVLYAEPWFIYEVDGTLACAPNDTSRFRQWALNKIFADSAYCVQQGDPNVVIAIIDTGVDWIHPDLTANVWSNPGESGPDGSGGDKEDNGVDDDRNGFIDDWHGWDFGGADYRVIPSPGDNDPKPTNNGAGHGTHVAGIAGAMTNNTRGIAGVSFNSRIMPVKAGSDNDNRGPGGTPYIVYGFAGILYAALNGADIINVSWGGAGAAQFEQEVVDSATAYGSLVVGAAGNGNSEEANYPASYKGAMSVTATTTTDSRASYSQYGEYVDVAAPGGDGPGSATWVLSTWYPQTYAYLTGTSMATPHAAGVAALVKSHFPAYTPDQVREQVRVTSDDINAIIPAGFRFKLGRGRINAYNAVTMNLPSVRVTSWSAVDSVVGNNNGALEPNEQFAFVHTFTNYLQPTSASATLRLTTTDGNVQIIDGNAQLGVVPTGGSVTNTADPFIVFIRPTIPSGRNVQFLLEINDGSYIDYQLITVLMNPTFGTHYVNNVQVTLTNNGRIGFNDFDNNLQGVGFTYKGVNHLFEGGLIIGQSATKIVDAVRNPEGLQDADFRPSAGSPILRLATPGTVADQEGFALYTDSTAPAANRIGLRIDQKSFQFSPAPDTNYVIVRYDIYNISASEVTGLYAGLFMDWDMMPNYASNRAAVDVSRSMGYTWDQGAAASNPVYAGVRALDSIAGFRVLLNNGNLDLSRASKYDWVSGGIVTNDTINDVHVVVSEGPLTIPVGARKRIGFALVAGNNLADLQRNADFAKAKWNYINSVDDVRREPGTLPSAFSLEQNYPNPFNPTTTITYDIAEAGTVLLTVYNTLGQEVQRLVNRAQAPGRYTATFDASSLPSGMYLYRLTVTGTEGRSRFTEAKKLLLVR